MGTIVDKQSGAVTEWECFTFPDQDLSRIYFRNRLNGEHFTIVVFGKPDVAAAITLLLRSTGAEIRTKE